MNVGKVCNRPVMHLAETVSVRHAAELMSDHNVGSLVVTRSDGDRLFPAGLVTDRDIITQVVAKGIDPDVLTVGDIMTEDPLVADEEDTISNTLDAMREMGVRRVPVLDAKGSVVGVFALDDLLQLLATHMQGIAAITRAQHPN